jgi:hypothetical protein
MADDPEKVAPQTKALSRRVRAPSVLSPRNSTQLLEYSKLMAASNMVPEGFKGDPAKIAVAIQMGAELGMTPVQALTCIAVINGMPAMYGDGLNAVLRASGELDLSFGAGGIDERPPDVAWEKKEGYCAIKLKGWDKPMERRFSMEDAERAGLIKRSQGGANARGVGPWISYPGRMLMFKSRNWVFRDGAAHILKGLQQGEILDDVLQDAEFTLKEPQRIEPGEQKAIAEFISTTATPSGPKAPTRSTGGSSAPAEPQSDQITWSGAIKSLKKIPTKNPKFPKYVILGSDGKEFQTIKADVMELARGMASTGEHVVISYVTNKFGNDIVDIKTKEQPPEDIPIDAPEPGSEG